MALQDTLDGFEAAAASVGVTGAIRKAAVGADLPVGMAQYDTTTHSNLGYISDDGVEEGRDEDKAEFVPWQEATAIRSEVTKSVVTLKFILWQSTRGTICYFYGVKDSDIIDEPDGSWSFYEGGKPDLSFDQICLDVVDKGQLRRTILANAQVSERGSIVYKSDQMIGYEVTVTAFPGPDGWSVKRTYKGLHGDVPAPVLRTVTITGGPTGGTFTLSFGGQTTSPLAFNASASAVQAALQALSTVGVGKATVTGSAGGPYTVTLDGTLVGNLSSSGAGLTGGTSPAVNVVATP